MKVNVGAGKRLHKRATNPNFSAAPHCERLPCGIEVPLRRCFSVRSVFTLYIFTVLQLYSFAVFVFKLVSPHLGLIH